MKNTISILLPVIFCLLFSGCGKRSGKQDRSTELTTIRTLGLAYLEEFRHEEAEKEFLKFIKLSPGDKFGYANLGLTYLRTGRYEEAKKQLGTALTIAPEDGDIRLILATVYQMNDERALAVEELKKALIYNKSHMKVLYQLTEMLAGAETPESESERKEYLISLSDNAPGNLVPLMNLTDLYIKTCESDKALEILEKVVKQFPEFPAESIPFYDKTISLLKKNDCKSAIIQFTIFHNYLKVSSPYQAGIMDLKGPGGSLIGFPLITFDKPDPAKSVETGAKAEEVRFTDATKAAGLDIILPALTVAESEFLYNTVIKTADYDSDGDQDIYAGSYDPVSQKYRHWLFTNQMGRYTDEGAAAGLKRNAGGTSAEFVDFDNDGFLDLYMVSSEADALLRNAEKGLFRDVTERAGIEASGANRAVFLDYDHDGDLDLYLLKKGKNLLFRNNADGTFTETAGKAGLEGMKTNSRDAVFGDFDEDGDIDLVVTSEDGKTVFYSNQRQGIFRDETEKAGLNAFTETGAIAAADINNDGYLDLFIAGADGNRSYICINRKDGSFTSGDSYSKVLSSTGFTKINDAAFTDFDNDGFPDLILAGVPEKTDGSGIAVFRNNGNESLENVSDILPPGVKPSGQIELFDYNDDGDLDILSAGLDGGITLLRNDGGNNNHFIKMKLVGLRTGSAKNNFFGIGAKVEMRAGDLYNTMVVTTPEIHFGIGNKPRADVIRITWTNGVPQNIFMPGSDQAIIEAQTLKGSCPFLYTWNGKEFVFAKDILWRSALGMPLGIMGGTTAYAFPDASDDYIKIPEEIMKPDEGYYTIQVTSELWETIYTDMIELVAADHPAETDLYVPEQFSPPPFPGLTLYSVINKKVPVSAVDNEGNDLLPFISEKDDSYTPGAKPAKYQGITAIREIIVDPGKLNTAGRIALFMTGWIFPTDASINYAMAQSDAFSLIHPEIQVINPQGKWQTIDSPGFPMGKDKTVISDLTGKFLSDDKRVRIRTNMDIHWDQIFLGEYRDNQEIVRTVLKPESADLHFRGFSAEFRKGGRYGPHWFDYSSADLKAKWLDLTGNYTRYGDVLPLLTAPDNMYIISNAGDEVTIKFDARGLPALKDGWKRDFFIRSVGWVKDGDINTAAGSTVLPLPFHGMKSYPPAPDDKYPDSEELREYNRKYNTRFVSGEACQNAVRDGR